MLKSEKKEASRESLLNKGIDVLMQQGYHGTGLKEILDAVNIPKGSFYNYFDSKEDFAAKVIQHYVDPFVLRLAAHLQQSETDALAAMQHYFDELIAQVEKNDFKGGCLLGNLMGEVADTSSLCQQSLKVAVNRFRELLQSGLAKAQQQGTVRADKSAEDMADLLINTWQGALLRAKIEKSSRPVRQCCEDLLGNFFRSS
ncbi:TetR family transcriptional regulator C-terminal domain-containing protein [Nitrosomonas europaea]|uniref:TetR/AcrR family transcriptional regulator n=1 Tax=Nitrosomonas TaxID=914 RepID=UPI002B3759E9|nr:TetR family transcriptional regulator C-terminal domain-containing protein [Nitrosomonas sp.]MEB2332068.1 TetR family transcriptional regulator C-terminal domain-containing protein [Nitrosomonas sp.]